MTFPRDDYTPFGYLDLPAHTRNLTPLGVIRSDGLGFRWHVPAYAGLYGGRRETYRAGFRIAVDGALHFADFEAVSAPYHSKNVVVFEVARGDVRLQIEWIAVGDHALRAMIRCQTPVPPARLTIHVDYTRLLSANGEWGESGLVGRRENDRVVLQGFEDGDAIVVAPSMPPRDLSITGESAESIRWADRPGPPLASGASVPVVGTRGDTVTLRAVLGFAAGEVDGLEIFVARGKTAPAAIAHLDWARRQAEGERARKLALDAAFWSGAPRLDGDWPDHWRRGIVYDLETIRMMVKPPVGIYAHPWDAMQIHAPRVVLAEAAIDALVLAYADPALAQAMFAGTFLDAPAPNVPCSREDGTFNMVAADGTVCGTAPQWGYPWLVAEWLAAVRPDPAWLERLYPRLAAYLDWWLRHRRDDEGWLVHACSWEAGQDESPRFGPQPLGGGHPTRHLRAVDLQAAFAHAARVMHRFAGTLGLRHDVAKWDQIAEEFAGRTRQLWHGDRYADHDARAGAPTAIDDIMLLAPPMLGLADPARAEALRRRIDAIDPDALVWPVLTWTAVEAAIAVGRTDRAAGLAAAVCDRAYRFWDAREPGEGRTLPGIACEYWPPHGRCGGEGYGWGALTTHLLAHVLIGLTPRADALLLRPNLPPDSRRPGRRYGLTLRWRERPIAVTLEPLDGHRVQVTLNGTVTDVAWGAQIGVAWDALGDEAPEPWPERGA